MNRGSWIMSDLAICLMQPRSLLHTYVHMFFCLVQCTDAPMQRCNDGSLCLVLPRAFHVSYRVLLVLVLVIVVVVVIMIVVVVVLVLVIVVVIVLVIVVVIVVVPGSMRNAQSDLI